MKVKPYNPNQIYVSPKSMRQPSFQGRVDRSVVKVVNEITKDILKTTENQKSAQEITERSKNVLEKLSDFLGKCGKHVKLTYGKDKDNTLCGFKGFLFKNTKTRKVLRGSLAGEGMNKNVPHHLMISNNQIQIKHPNIPVPRLVFEDEYPAIAFLKEVTGMDYYSLMDYEDVKTSLFRILLERLCPKKKTKIPYTVADLEKMERYTDELTTKLTPTDIYKYLAKK